MKAKSIILILISIGCGLVATIGISKMLDNRNKDKGETAKILVSTAEVDSHVALTPQMVKMEEWPKDRIPKGAISDFSKIQGLLTSQRLYAGEPILEGKLGAPNDQEDVARKIPTGFRAFPIKVAGGSNITNHTRPGDHVDILAFFKKSADIPRTGNQTILRNIRVFSVNNELTREKDEDGEMHTTKSITLLLTPEQVEKVNLAGRLGELTCTLRPTGEEDAGPSTAGTNIGDLIPGAGKDEEPVSHPMDTKGQGNSKDYDALAEYIRQQNARNAVGSPAPTEHQVATAGPEEDSSYMDVIGPSGVVRYKFSGKDPLPTIVGQEDAYQEEPTDEEVPISAPVRPGPDWDNGDSGTEATASDSDASADDSADDSSDADTANTSKDSE